MPVNEPVTDYRVNIAQISGINYNKTIILRFASGEEVFIRFPKNRPANFLFSEYGHVVGVMAEKDFAHVYHLLQTEDPVYFTALTIPFGGINILRLGSGPEPLGEGYSDALGLLADLTGPPPLSPPAGLTS